MYYRCDRHGFDVIATGTDDAGNVVNVYETKVSGRMRYLVGYVSSAEWKVSGSKRANPVTGLNVREEATTSFVALDWNKEKIMDFAKKYFNVKETTKD